MVIPVDDGTWAGSGKASLEEEGIAHKLLEIRKDKFRIVYLLGRQAATLKDRTIMVDSLKYVTVRKPVHVSAARRNGPSKGLAGKEMSQHHFLTH